MKSDLMFNTTGADLAAAFGNAGVNVVGTPALIGFLEIALVTRDENRLEFAVELRWGEIVVMRGFHKRRIVDLARFMARLGSAGAG